MDEVDVMTVEDYLKLVAELLFALDVQSILRTINLDGHTKSLQLFHILISKGLGLEESFTIIYRVGIHTSAVPPAVLNARNSL